MNMQLGVEKEIDRQERIMYTIQSKTPKGVFEWFVVTKRINGGGLTVEKCSPKGPSIFWHHTGSDITKIRKQIKTKILEKCKNK